MFSNEEKCLLYLPKLRFKHGYICPKCKGQQYWKSKKGKRGRGAEGKTLVIVAVEVLEKKQEELD